MNKFKLHYVVKRPRVIFTDRSSAKDIFLNPAWFKRSELFKAVRRDLLEHAQLLREVEKLLAEIDLQKSRIFERKRARAKILKTI